MQNAVTGTTESPEPRYFGLLHVDRDNNYNVNLRKGRGKQAAVDPIDIYLRCAATCAASARAAGLNFAVITNQIEFLSNRAKQLELHAPAFVEHQFERVLPRGIPFYSAHFKLEVLAAFGAGKWGPVSALVDLDTVFLKALPVPRAGNPALFVYDISQQIFPAFGAERVSADLATVAGTHFAEPVWYGGEAIAGSATAFAVLSETVDRVWPQYLENIASLHHVGDEMVVSAALNLMRANGHPLTDWGASGQVLRWWSARTLSRQPALRDALNDCRLLHLPADKEFLAGRAVMLFEPNAFVDTLAASLRTKLWLQKIADFLITHGSKHRKYASRI